MDDESREVVDAVEDLADKAKEAEIAEAVIEDVIDAAEKRVEEAEKTAEAIAAAAMESERGREIYELRKDIEKWRDEQYSLENQVREIQSKMETMTGQLAALATLEITSQVQAQPVPSSSLSTPLPSDQISEAITEVETIIPENLSESAVDESPAPVVSQKRRRWI